ncbi:PH domain-containing protein [Streptomyces hydrogenans]|uniref:PH domain-containing protein n=1 Tax=Streptomyces hydrogenans TaxID=1873719 RepID=UPI0035D596AB
MTARSSLPRTYRISPGRITGVLVATGLALPAALIPILADDLMPGWAKGLTVALLLAFVGWMVFAARHLSTSADLKGIRVRGYVRDRRIAWEDIQDIRAVPNPGAGMARGAPDMISYAYRRDGRRLQLFYVDDNHVRVDQEIGALRAAWEELRGEGWSEDAEAVRSIDRRQAREEAATTALSWSIMSVLGFIVLAVALLLTDSLFLGLHWFFAGPVLVFLAVWLVGRYRSR